MAKLDSMLAWLRRDRSASPTPPAPAPAPPAPVEAPASGSTSRHGPYRRPAVQPIELAALSLHSLDRFAAYQLVATADDHGPGLVKCLIEGPAKGRRCAVMFFDTSPALRRRRRAVTSRAHDAAHFLMRLDEARLLLRLRHHNQGRVLEIAHEREISWLLAEYPRGETLHGIQARVERGAPPPSPEVILAAFADFAEGLHAAHVTTDGAGVPLGLHHGHLVPDALLITLDGRGKVVDWGLDGLIAAYHSSVPDLPLRPARLRHLAPEMVRGLPFDGRADVFALGVMLYDLTTGGSLFLARTELDTLMEVMKQDPPRPSTRVAGYPPELEAVVLRALAKDPAARATAKEVAITLRALLAKRGVVDPRARVAKYVRVLTKA